MRQYSISILLILCFSLPIKGKSYLEYFNILNSDSLLSRDSIAVADSNLVIDSISVQDSLIAVDTLKPLFYKPISNTSVLTLSKNKINRKDYRYTGDLINQIHSGYLRDLGTLGQPSEITLYGLGFNNLSFLVNGINRNNRITNSFDAYSYQTENIDSLIVYPITQSFIYNNYNNPATIEVIDKDSLYSIPYSRIKFYQAPDGEGMFDGRASLYISKRINLTLGTSNQSIDSRYNNSDYSNWLAFVKLRYMMSNKFNFVIDYSYQASNVSLYGGVDVDAVAPSELESILYDPLQAPVNYPFDRFDPQSTRYQKKTAHYLSGKILSTIIPYVNSDLTFYYDRNLTEFRQNQFTNRINLPEIIHDNENQTFGVSFNSKYKSSIIDASFLYNFETNEIDAQLFNKRFSFNTFSIAGTASLNLLKDVFIPTAYIKNLTFNGNSYFGFGIDAETAKFLNLSLSGGVSYFEKPYNFIEGSASRQTYNNKIKSKALHFGVNFASENFETKLNYFFLQQDNSLLPLVYEYADTLLINEVSNFHKFNRQSKGISLSGNINYGVVGLEFSGTYYIQDEDYEKLNPEYFLFTGLYYKNILFNRNLNLKTGFNLYLYGPRYHYDYDFEKSIAFQNYIPFGGTIQPSGNPLKIKSNLKVDFFLSARIQDSAIFFFIFENLLDEKYFIASYYPMPSTGLRFGVAWEFLD